MDCPSEEQIIRMKLADLENIKSLEFNIAQRQLIVYHEGNYDKILQRLHSLKFNTSLTDSNPAEKPVADFKITSERKLLYQVITVNLFFFGLELITGFIANSMGLLADSLDMLADSVVYSLALIAAGGVISFKKKIAKASGYIQLVLIIIGLLETIRRFLVTEPTPKFEIMIVISILALCGNIVSLLLLQKSQSKEAHMQASMIFTSNDVIANLGVIIAALCVWLTGSEIPDLVIGTVVFAFVGYGVIRIFKLAR